MKVDGACHCGQITYEADVEPDGVRLCHCTDCQQLSGSAFRANISTPADKFVLLTGEPKIYVKVADSGARRAHGFCPNCGSPIYATSADEPASYSLRIGNIKQRAMLRLTAQIWCDSALLWAMDLTGVPGEARQ